MTSKRNKKSRQERQQDTNTPSKSHQEVPGGMESKADSDLKREQQEYRKEYGGEGDQQERRGLGDQPEETEKLRKQAQEQAEEAREARHKRRHKKQEGVEAKQKDKMRRSHKAPYQI